MRHVVGYAQGDAFSRIDLDYDALDNHEYLQTGVQDMDFDVNLRRHILDGTVNVGCGRRATQQIADELVNDPKTFPDAIPIREISQRSSKKCCSQSMFVVLASLSKIAPCIVRSRAERSIDLSPVKSYRVCCASCQSFNVISKCIVVVSDWLRGAYKNISKHHLAEKL